MRCCLILCVCLLIACSVGNVFAASEKPLRIGIDNNYYPFSYKNSQGEYMGFDVDIATGLCARMLRPCQILPMPFEELFTAMQQGKLDVIVAGLAKNAEREQTLSFVVPYYRSRTAFVGKAGEKYPQVNAQALQGKRVTAQQGSVQHAFIVKELVQSVYVPAATVDDALAAVRDGKADIALADSLVCMAVLMAEDMQDLDYVAEPLASGHESSIAYIAVGLGENTLAEQVKEAFGQLRMSGEFSVINQKYFPFSIY